MSQRLRIGVYTAGCAHEVQACAFLSEYELVILCKQWGTDFNAQWVPWVKRGSGLILQAWWSSSSTAFPKLHGVSVVFQPFMWSFFATQFCCWADADALEIISLLPRIEVLLSSMSCQI